MYRNKTVDAIYYNHRREIQKKDEMIDGLVNKIMYMADKTWTPPPRPVYPEPEEEETFDTDRYVLNFDTLPEEAE